MERSGYGSRSGSGSICTYINAPDPDSGGLKTQGSYGSGSGYGSGTRVTGNHESILNLIRRRHPSISRKCNQTKVLFTKEFFYHSSILNPLNLCFTWVVKLVSVVNSHVVKFAKFSLKSFQYTKILCSYSPYSEILVIKINLI